MIDGSSRNLVDNIALVREVVEYAHAHGVCVEAEIGRIRGMGVEGRYDGSDYLARVEDVMELAETTKVNSLAVGIGTAHGFYEGEPHINFERLEEIASAVEIPLVLHGGTGLADSDIRKGIKRGISKVNIGTIIHVTYMKALREALSNAGETPYTLDVMELVLPQVEAIVADRIDAVVDHQ
jgi:ketose-bisphosphate aldolase